jgi:DNA-binding HxlR family transcriptional regulator
LPISRMVQPPSVFDAHSPARQVAERLADRWTAMVVCVLATGPAHYGELRRRIGGISGKMLTQTLRGMKRDGLVVRTARATRPPRVEYALTPLGETLVGPLSGILTWAEAHFSEVDEARASFDRGFSS